jgi:hypothetical protein
MMMSAHRHRRRRGDTDVEPGVMPVGYLEPTESDVMEDNELEALAMAADPDQPIGPDAVPISIYLASISPLPEWYMAPVMTRRSGRWQRFVIAALIGAFVLIEAVGLCSTYGQPPFH